MRIELDITNATIFRRRNGTDKISLVTAIPDPIPMFACFPLTFNFDAPQGQGEKILAGLFPGVEYTLIEEPKAGNYKFSRDR